MDELSEDTLSLELNAYEAARVLGVVVPDVLAGCRAGFVECRRLGGPKSAFRITVRELLKWRGLPNFDAARLASIIDGIKAKESLDAKILGRELSIMDASMILGCCERTVWNLCKAGKLAHRRIGGGSRRIRVRLDDLIKWRSRPSWDEDLWEFFAT